MKALLLFLNRLFGRSDIHIDGDVYMKRWLLNFHFFGLRLHNILRSDGDRELHDHPFSFLTFILKGGYWEHRDDGSMRWYGAPAVLYRKAETLHRLDLGLTSGRRVSSVEHIKLEPAWTFVIRGPIRRQWGFLTAQGWVHWKTFTDSKNQGKERSAGDFVTKSST